MRETHYTDNQTGEKYVVRQTEGMYGSAVSMYVNGEYIGTQNWIGFDYLTALEKQINEDPKKGMTITKSQNQPTK